MILNDPKVLAEAMAKIEALEAERVALWEALTPSGATKAAYMSEFSWREPDFDECGGRTYRHNVVPWTTIKEIMAAIRKRADRQALEGHDDDGTGNVPDTAIS